MAAVFQVQQTLLDAAAAQGETLAGLSRLIGRNAAYLQQFVHRGTPRRLAERDRERLARYLGLEEAALGGPTRAAPMVIAVPRLAALAAAGPGALNDDDRVVETLPFDADQLRRLGVRDGAASLVTARGTSMEPLIHDGDTILVDTADRRVAAAPALFVLRLDGAVLVKRLSRRDGAIAIASDNPAAPPIASRPPGEVEVIGRVAWLGRALR